jgi:hypothetical protein
MRRMSQHVIGRKGAAKQLNIGVPYNVKNDERRRDAVVRAVKEALAFVGLVVQLGFTSRPEYFYTHSSWRCLDYRPNLSKIEWHTPCKAGRMPLINMIPDRDAQPIAV